MRKTTPTAHSQNPRPETSPRARDRQPKPPPAHPFFYSKFEIAPALHSRRAIPTNRRETRTTRLAQFRRTRVSRRAFGIVQRDLPAATPRCGVTDPLVKAQTHRLPASDIDADPIWGSSGRFQEQVSDSTRNQDPDGSADMCSPVPCFKSENLCWLTRWS
jgi:hypothetical protein